MFIKFENIIFCDVTLCTPAGFGGMYCLHLQLPKQVKQDAGSTYILEDGVTELRGNTQTSPHDTIAHSHVCETSGPSDTKLKSSVF
jgi:hypothetical protein